MAKKRCEATEETEEISFEDAVMERIHNLEHVTEQLVQRLEELEAENSQLRDEMCAEKGERKTSSGTEDMLKMIQLNAARRPALGSYSKEDLRIFLKECQEFERLCPVNWSLFLSMEYLNDVCQRFGKSVEEIKEMENKELELLLCGMHSSANRFDSEQRMKKIQMRGDASWSNLSEYQHRFEFEVKCLGTEHKLPDKSLAKIFTEGLKPEELRTLVKAYECEVLEEVKELARKLLPTVQSNRIIQNIQKNGKSNVAETVNKSIGNKQSNDDKKEDGQKTSKYMAGIICYKCKEKGHFASKCTKQKPVAKSTKVHMVDMDVMTNPVRRRNDGLCRVDAQIGVINGKTTSVEMLLDTGANKDVVSQRIINDLKKAGCPMKVLGNGSMQMTLASGKCIAACQKVQLDIMFYSNNREVSSTRTFVVIKEITEDVILSLDTIQELQLWELLQRQQWSDDIDCEEEQLIAEEEADRQWLVETEPEMVNLCQISAEINSEFSQKTRLEEIINKYGVLFGEFDQEGLRVKPMEIKLKPGRQLNPQTCRYVKPEISKLLKDELDRMVEQKILKPTNSASVASPLVIVPKRDGTIRIAVDYRHLNDNLIPFAGAIPDMKSMFQYLAGNRFFAKLDNLWGYHQLRIAEEDQELTTIITPFGLYKWTRCPFGISTAPGVYQDRMAHVILRDHVTKGCLVYIDDTIVYGKTEEEFLKHLEEVLQSMVKFNVRLKPAKCSFGCSEVEFLGHIFNGQGYHLSERRKMSITQLKEPTTFTQLKSMLGMVNYFRNFIPDLSRLLIPLTDLTKGRKKGKLDLTDEARVAIEKVKEAVVNAGVLRFLQRDGRIKLYTDASQEGIAGVLTQVQEETKEYPIMFVSKKLTEVASRWSTIEQECYAIFYCITQLKSFLYGRHFTVVTDHRNLLFLKKSTIPKIVRWRLQLQEFSFNIEHIDGADNVVADALSRLCMITAVTEEESNGNHVDVMKSFHNCYVGHHGVSRMMKILEEANIKWPNMRRDVTQFVKNCLVCQKIKTQPVPQVNLVQRTLQGRYPMEHVAVDTIGPLTEDQDGHRYILVIIDEYSKYCELYATKTVQAQEYVRCLVNHVATFGMMKRVRSDGGTQFTARVCEQLAAGLGYEHHVILPYHPQANGIVERRNGEVMKHLRAIVLEMRVKDKWSQWLPIAQRILNTAFDRSIGTYPYRLIFGDRLRLREELQVNMDNMEGIEVEEYIQRLNVAIEEYSELSRRYREIQRKRREDAWRQIDASNAKEFKVGEYVLVTYPSRPVSKLNAIYRGPLLIVEKVRDDIVRCLDLVSKKHIEFHVDRLRILHVANDVMPDELLELAAADVDEFEVEEILEHRGDWTKPGGLWFKVRWKGYDPSEDSWIPYRDAKDLALLDVYEREHRQGGNA